MAFFPSKISCFILCISLSRLITQPPHKHLISSKHVNFNDFISLPPSPSPSPSPTSPHPPSLHPQSYLKNGGAGPLNANRCLGPGAPPGHASQFHPGPLSSSSSSNFLSNSSASLRHASSAPQRTHMALLGMGGLSHPQWRQGHAVGIGGLGSLLEVELAFGYLVGSAGVAIDVVRLCSRNLDHECGRMLRAITQHSVDKRKLLQAYENQLRSRRTLPRTCTVRLCD
ncbi:hypothetical protein HBI70_199610 [Parastagonospora nodorum]|nr:hypothetical protein HBI70_199610 [Parastagonospora nodorum]